MGKHNSVSEMARALLAHDKGFVDQLDDEIANTRMGKILFALRCHRGYSQEDMASLLQCSQSRISKIEHSNDDDIRLGDMLAYSSALDLHLSIRYDKEANAVESLKYHTDEIGKHLNRLIALADDDGAMLAGVAKVYREILFRMFETFRECASKFPTEHRPSGLEITASPELLTAPSEEEPDGNLVSK